MIIEQGLAWRTAWWKDSPGKAEINSFHISLRAGPSGNGFAQAVSYIKCQFSSVEGTEFKTFSRPVSFPFLNNEFISPNP